AAGSAAPIRPAPRGPDLPLSHAQQGLWFADQLNPGHPVYNNYRAVRLAGPLDPAVLRPALDELVRRHAGLRTTFPTRDGRPVQVSAAARVRLGGAALPAGSASGVDRLLREEVCRPFDLARGPLLRVTLGRVVEQDHVLLVVAHHIVTDAWSMALLM